MKIYWQLYSTKDYTRLLGAVPVQGQAFQIRCAPSCTTRCLWMSRGLDRTECLSIPTDSVSNDGAMLWPSLFCILLIGAAHFPSVVRLCEGVVWRGETFCKTGRPPLLLVGICASLWSALVLFTTWGFRTKAEAHSARIIVRSRYPSRTRHDSLAVHSLALYGPLDSRRPCML